MTADRQERGPKTKAGKVVQVVGLALSAAGAIAFSTDAAWAAPLILTSGVAVWLVGRLMHWWARD